MPVLHGRHTLLGGSAGLSRVPSAAPGEALLASAKAGEVAAAEFAAIGSRAQPQHQHGAGRRVVILLRPCAEFHSKAFRTAGVADGTKVPDGGLESVVTLPATKRQNADDAAEPFPEGPRLGDPQVFRSAPRTSYESHRELGPPGSRIILRLCPGSRPRFVGHNRRDNRRRPWPIAPAPSPRTSPEALQ